MTDIINEEENTDSLPEEEQESVVVDNGQTYVSSETTVIAQQAAEHAKLWAQESERQANLSSGSATTAVDARDDAIEAKEYAEAAITDTNMITVATDLQSTPSNIKIVAQNIDVISDIVENIDKVLDAKNQAIAAAGSASQSETNALAYTNEAKQWAIGDPSEPAGNSAKYWAEYAEDVAQDVGNPANKDLSNLSAAGQAVLDAKQDAATAVNYDNITNCITEIPQDIKLELNNGTLTLKAGSKVYVPNGVGKFDIVTVPSDTVFHTGTIGSSTLNLMFCCNLTGGFGARAKLNDFESGSTEPSNTSHIWYDTTNNAIKAYENGSWVRKYSLPIGIYHRENGNAVSIKQVFNGFGYIGSTVFALPGVKGLIPNGRNADGTLRSTAFHYTTVKTVTNTVYRPHAHLVCSIDSIACMNTLDYNEELNLNWQGTLYVNTECDCGLLSTSSESPYAITSFTPKTVFHAVDYNDAVKYSDKADVVGWSMPDYSAGVSLTVGTQYTADIDCYVLFSVRNVTLNSDVGFYINNLEVAKLGNNYAASDDWAGFFIPKGTNFKAVKGNGTTAIYAKYPLKGVK